MTTRATARTLGHAVAVGLVVGGSWVVGACIIAEPPSTLPVPAVPAPKIVSAFPPNTAVQGILPSLTNPYLLYLQIDPTRAFEWRLYIDYDPIGGGGLVGFGALFPDPGADDGGIREVTMTQAFGDADPKLCHVIEGLVAFSFGGVGLQDFHTFAPGTGDSVTWFYSPTGDLSGCPHFDAGPVDGAFPPPVDAGSLFLNDGAIE